MPVVVYTLRDPETKEPKYVGQTVQLPIRLTQHYSQPTYYLAPWVDSLKARGLRFLVDVLEAEDPDAIARFLIDAYADTVLNIATGGRRGFSCPTLASYTPPRKEVGPFFARLGALRSRLARMGVPDKVLRSGAMSAELVRRASRYSRREVVCCGST